MVVVTSFVSLTNVISQYDIDLGPITLSDWFYPTAFQVMQAVERNQSQPADNFLVQGMNLNLNVTGAESAGTQYKLVFQPGKRHLLRFINTSTQVSFGDISRHLGSYSCRPISASRSTTTT